MHEWTLSFDCFEEFCMRRLGTDIIRHDEFVNIWWPTKIPVIKSVDKYKSNPSNFHVNWWSSVYTANHRSFTPSSAGPFNAYMKGLLIEISNVNFIHLLTFIKLIFHTGTTAPR
jgi:hypothetical protein